MTDFTKVGHEAHQSGGVRVVCVGAFGLHRRTWSMGKTQLQYHDKYVRHIDSVNHQSSRFPGFKRGRLSSRSGRDCRVKPLRKSKRPLAELHYFEGRPRERCHPSRIKGLAETSVYSASS